MTTSELNNILNKFPDNATSWSQATDEIRDLLKNIRETHNEHSTEQIDSLDFSLINTPAMFNIRIKAEIRRIWGKMDDSGRDRINS